MSTEVRLSKYLRSHGSRLRALLRQPQLRWSPAINMTAKELVIDTVGFGASSNETINDLVSSCAKDEDHDYPMNDLDAITGSIARSHGRLTRCYLPGYRQRHSRRGQLYI